jgi:hypothetical protein
LSNNCGANLHINVMYGENVHHILEACFKGCCPGARPGNAGGSEDRRGPFNQGKIVKTGAGEQGKGSESENFSAPAGLGGPVKGFRMIAIIDYGMGNLRSVQKGFEKLGFKAEVTSDPRLLLEADRVVLPGVGAFPDCMRNLEQGGFM